MNDVNIANKSYMFVKPQYVGFPRKFYLLIYQYCSPICVQEGVRVTDRHKHIENTQSSIITKHRHTETTLNLATNNSASALSPLVFGYLFHAVIV